MSKQQASVDVLEGNKNKKMTAKEFVKDKIPNARSERHSTRIGIRNHVYYLIRDGNSFMYMAEGETESKAWINAKKKIQANTQTKKQ